MKYILRKACVADVKTIHAALLEASKQGLLLPRSLADLYHQCRDFFVVENTSRQFLGCGALSIIWEDIAEVRSLVVRDAFRGNGLGRALVDACTDEAVTMGLSKVFTLTYQQAFFECLGFKEIGKDTLPQKIWADCLNCAKFPDCDEIAMLREL